MENLLRDLKPITSKIAFIDADTSSIVDGFLQWQTPLAAKNNNSFEKVALDDNLESALLALCPLTTTEQRRYLFIPTRNRWTAFFDNGHTGTDRTAPEILGKNLNAKTTYIAYDTETEETTFDYYDRANSNGGIDLVRSIAVIKESGWEFHQYGTPLPFEKVDSYKSRQVKKRFNVELLTEYLKSLGIDAFNEKYYYPQNSILLKKIGPKFSNTKELGLTEAQSFFNRN